MEMEWQDSPITGRPMVMVDGNSKMDLSTGFFTNDKLNYSKEDFDSEEFESGMPENIRVLRFDDGESIWYPSTMQTSEDMLFPTGDTIENMEWCYAKIKKTPSGSVIDMENLQYFDRYLEAAKCVSGYSLGEI